MDRKKVASKECQWDCLLVIWMVGLLESQMADQLDMFGVALKVAVTECNLVVLSVLEMACSEVGMTVDKMVQKKAEAMASVRVASWGGMMADC